MKNKLLFIPLIAIPVIMIIFGSFFDLGINIALYDRNNIFGLTMAAIGEAPGYMAIAFFGGGMFFLGFKKYNLLWQKLMLTGLGIAAFLIALYFQSNHVINDNAFNVEHEWWAYLVAIPVGLIICGLGFFLGFYLSMTSDNDNLLKLFITIGIIALASVIITTLIKNIMDRTRFRYLADYASIGDYRPWWEKGILFNPDLEEEFKSFPSGHATAAAIGIAVLAYIPMFKSKWFNNKKLTYILLGVGVIWTLLLSFSRMLVGAHFLSDVGFGYLITMLVFFITDLIMYPKKNLEKNDEKEN
ncbi:MAG: phosphatase PAP2 family protein [Erysipelotrichaceae bacterium]|jgi:membrane-associated phospholipid phosphatase|nr:phosphatase PAP2 family protein [Erysipelotrichaceae bacterium]